VNKFIKTFLLNKDFTIYTNDKLIFSYNLFKKGLIKHILPCQYLTYKKDFKYTYLNFQDFSLKASTLIYIYKGYVFKNNLIILKSLIKEIKILKKVFFLKMLLFYSLFFTI
jgi:hypothetical protein